jgi:hypothetical protein
MANDAFSGAGQGAATGAMFGPWGAAVGGVLGGISGALGSRSSRRAAQQQRQALEQAQQVQREQYQQALGFQQPYSGLGNRGSAELGTRLNDLTRSFTNDDFVKDPGYDWRMAEGNRAVESSAAARGGVLSGAAAKALQKYGQGFASNEFDKAYGRFTGTQDRTYNKLMGLVGVGQNAANVSSGLATGFGNSMAGNFEQQGNVNAAGTMGSANAIAGGVGQVYNAIQDNALLRAIQQRPGSFAGGNLASQYGSGAYRSPWASYGGEEG